ncbi:MAG: hypothetical protein HXS44_09180 [Theionarchaea archaeon]|nr:hypothetical protein [Theionarchaea archaeon]
MKIAAANAMHMKNTIREIGVRKSFVFWGFSSTKYLYTTAMRVVTVVRRIGTKERGRREFLRLPAYGTYPSSSCNENAMINSEYAIRINSALKPR